MIDKTRKLVILFVVTLLIGCSSFSTVETSDMQETSCPSAPTPVPAVEATIPNTHVHILHSSTIDRDYRIYVALPSSYSSGSSKRYPVIYVLDGNAWFGVTTTITQMLAFGRELPEVIVVGIGYPTDAVDEILVLRETDLTPTQTKPNSGGAEQFLEFLEKDVISFIDSTYRTEAMDRTLVGKSYGGMFALYALFHKPEVFNRHIVMSPTLWWDDRVTFEYEETFAATHTGPPVKLFLSVGSREPEGQYRMVSGLRELNARLEGRQYDSLQVVMTVMEDETHFSVTAGAISKGIRAVFE